MISLVDTRGAGPPGPNSDASHCGRNAWQKSSTSQKTSTIQHHRLHHSAIAAYLKKLFRHNPLVARKHLIRVSYSLSYAPLRKTWSTGASLPPRCHSGNMPGREPG